jgi:uncharacterized protein (DUF934 family)
MSKIIRNGQRVIDAWKILRLGANDSAHEIKLPVGEVLVPPSVWQARRAELIHREYEHGWALGVWLAADESISSIERDLDDFSVIAIEFDRFSDGNSYLSARQLRESHNYRGELRAIGDVPQGKLAWLYQLGFDTIAVPATRQFAGAVIRPHETGWYDPALVAAAA